MRVLFVCTGNICRSPTADGIFRAMVVEAGLEGRVTVDSAGTISYHAGNPPDSRSIAAAARRGYDLQALRARQLRPSDYQDFDLLLAMDDGHRQEMLALAPMEARDRVQMFTSFGALGAKEVPDPYYGGGQGFEDVLDLVEDSCRGLLEHVRRQLKA